MKVYFKHNDNKNTYCRLVQEVWEYQASLLHQMQVVSYQPCSLVLKYHRQSSRDEKNVIKHKMPTLSQTCKQG